MTESNVKIPDPIVGEIKRAPMSFKKKAGVIFFVGFFLGWLWMTWAVWLEHWMGLPTNFFILLLPF
jgi:hypothetical protein